MTQAHTDRAHAKLSPSASHRWMECPGSVRLSEGIERKSSHFADEGTAAHELAARCLTEGRNPDEYLDMFVNIDAEYEAHKFIPEDKTRLTMGRVFEIDQEMVDSVAIYVDFVNGLINADPGYTEHDIEFRFDLQHIADGMFGTGDAVVYNARTRHLTVADFKYGRGVAVDPDSNPQLLAYGIGAVRRHDNRGVSGVTLAVVQPRCRHPKGSVRTWTTDPLTLLEFEHELKVAAVATEAPDAPLLPGDWCRFCPAAALCPALRDKARSAAASEFSVVGEIKEVKDVAGLDAAGLAAALGEVEIVETWCRRIREHAHDTAVHGTSIPGWKLVEKRAIRRWKDEGEIPTVLKTIVGVPDEEIWQRKLASPAQIEKSIGKKRSKEIAGYATKQSSGAVLVPESDARPAVRADGSEFSTVGD